MDKKTIQDRHPNFRSDGHLFLMRCFNCEPRGGRENWAVSVVTGQCAFCGWTESSEKGLSAVEAKK